MSGPQAVEKRLFGMTIGRPYKRVYRKNRSIYVKIKPDPII